MNLTHEERIVVAQALSIYIGSRAPYIKDPEFRERDPQSAAQWTVEVAAAERALAKIGSLL